MPSPWRTRRRRAWRPNRQRGLDDDTARTAMVALHAHLPAGSVLSLTHATGDFASDTRIQRLAELYREAGIPFWPRSGTALAILLGPWTLLGDRGLVTTATWRPPDVAFSQPLYVHTWLDHSPRLRRTRHDRRTDHMTLLKGSRPLIEDHAFIGDMQTAALVARDGSINRLCLPRFDSAAAFTGLLGTDKHGSWRIGPASPACTPAPAADRRRYRGESLVVETEWDTATGTAPVLDFMLPREDASQVIRIVEGVSGTVKMQSTLSPRFGHGKRLPWIHDAAAVSGPNVVWLDTSVPGTEKDAVVHYAFTVTAGECVAFTLSWQPSQTPAPEVPDAELALALTTSFWEEWVEHLVYEGPYHEAVIRSLITLKALTHSPTGGIVAAPTVSLPEELSGVRNWEYRYVWLRDAAATRSALLRTGYRDEAVRWRQWLLRAFGGDSQNLQIMYRLDGRRDMPELELGWLPGYEGPQPVRIGNEAVDQLQLDVPGEVIEMLAPAHEHGVARCENTEGLILKLVDYVREHWRKPDDGIWEARGGRRHFTRFKSMCWVAADRTVRLVEQGVLDADLRELVSLRDEIHAEVCEQAYDNTRNTFTRAYGSTELDASLLLLPHTRFLPADDPRVVGTVDAARRELAPDEVLVHRCQTDGPNVGRDGLPGGEGAFMLCSYWVVDALAPTDRLTEAERLFEQLLSLRSDLGLLSEEYDPVTGR